MFNLSSRFRNFKVDIFGGGVGYSYMIPKEERTDPNIKYSISFASYNNDDVHEEVIPYLGNLGPLTLLDTTLSVHDELEKQRIMKMNK